MVRLFRTAAASASRPLPTVRSTIAARQSLQNPEQIFQNALRLSASTVGHGIYERAEKRLHNFDTHLVGSEGSLLDNRIYSTRFNLRDKAWTELPVALADSGDVADRPCQAQFQPFFDALDQDCEMPHTSIDEAHQSFKILFACDKSAAEGRPVKISELT